MGAGCKMSLQKIRQKTIYSIWEYFKTLDDEKQGSELSSSLLDKSILKWKLMESYNPDETKELFADSTVFLR